MFSQTKVRILLDDVEFDSQDNVNPVFLKLKKHSNKTCESLVDLTQVLDSGENKTD